MCSTPIDRSYIPEISDVNNVFAFHNKYNIKYKKINNDKYRKYNFYFFLRLTKNIS